MTLLPKGQQATTVSGYIRGGGWKNTDPKKCQLCKASEVFIESDTVTRRVMVCDNCGGIEVISKGASSWWYHDAQLPANMSPRWLQLLATGAEA